MVAWYRPRPGHGAVLFDDPTSALDLEMIGEDLNVMTELAADGMTIVLPRLLLNAPSA